MDARIEKWCEKTDTRKSGIEYLINEYFIKTLGWSEERANKHVIQLFENGTIDEIKIMGQDGLIRINLKLQTAKAEKKKAEAEEKKRNAKK